MHISRFVLGDTRGGSDDVVKFKLIKPSLLRLRVPRHEQIDVDIYVEDASDPNKAALDSVRCQRKFTVDELTNRFVAQQSTGFGDEHILISLQAGEYHVRFAYHRRGSSGGADCPVFPFELEIEPTDNLRRLVAFQTACSTSTAPTLTLPSLLSATVDKPVVYDLKRSLASTATQLDATLME